MKRNRLGSNFGHAKIPVLRAVHGTNVDALRGGFEILQFCRQAWEQMISELYQGKNAGARWPHLSGDRPGHDAPPRLETVTPRAFGYRLGANASIVPVFSVLESHRSPPKSLPPFQPLAAFVPTNCKPPVSQ